jgi:truncated hemoglobin YjbI
MRTHFILLLATLQTMFTSAAFAADMAVSRGDLDGRAHQAASDVISLGAPMFNSGNREGCLRLYQGTLIALRTTLDHRPELVAAIDAKLAVAKGGGSTSEKAFALRAALDEVLKQCQAAASNKPLWDRLGGQAAVEAVIHDFVVLAAGNAQVNFLRDGQVKLDAAGVKNLEVRLVELVSATTGGPIKYQGRSMKSAHAGMKITDAEFDALGADLVAVLKKYNVPRAEVDELVAIVESTRADIVESRKAPLWDRLGGEAGVRAVTQEFLKTAAGDKKANIDRNGNYPLTEERVQRVEQLVVEFISSVTGGPLKYSGRDMKNSHAGMKITEEEFNVAAGHLIAALKKFNVPQAEIDELVGLVAGTAKDIIEVPAN